MLPLGLRVQNKLEALIDRHMQSIRASKVSLSSITSQQLWQESGRLDNNSEFFRFTDRKDAKWLLAPTHEEEITDLVKSIIRKPHDLPLRLYQVSRKYRDEKRPRGGLLRGREFVMKDLYTFDPSESQAHDTYAQVREAYNNLFDELKIPYIEARADSGNMGGTKSHEFHFPSKLGEDNLITCSKCDYAKNEEFVPPLELEDIEIVPHSSNKAERMPYQAFVSKDKVSLVKAFVPANGRKHTELEVNPFVVKKCLREHVDIDTGVENPKEAFMQSSEKQEEKTVFYLFNDSTPDSFAAAQFEQDRKWLKENGFKASIVKVSAQGSEDEILVKKKTGDPCPECASKGESGVLTITKAIEVAHTFHLGTRYSSKFDLRVPSSQGVQQKRSQEANSFVEMGCHGIGVSRLIAAAASAMSTADGLVWPRAISPFQVVIMTLKDIPETQEAHLEHAHHIYDQLLSDEFGQIDAILDDRADLGPGWKFKDAELIGYPVTVAIGSQMTKSNLVEIECRRLGRLKELLPLDQVAGRVQEILAQLDAGMAVNYKG